jgi:hypothetical protein
LVKFYWIMFLVRRLKMKTSYNKYSQKIGIENYLQNHENEKAKIVLVHEPGIEVKKQKIFFNSTRL